MRWCRYRPEFYAWQLRDDELLRRREACAQQRQQQQEQGGLALALHASPAQAAHRSKRSGKSPAPAAHPALPVEPHPGGLLQAARASWRQRRGPSSPTFWPWVRAMQVYRLPRCKFRHSRLQRRQFPHPWQNKTQRLQMVYRPEKRLRPESGASWLLPCAPARLLARFQQRRPSALRCYRPGLFAGVSRSRASSEKATAATWRAARSATSPRRVARSATSPSSRSRCRRHPILGITR